MSLNQNGYLLKPMNNVYLRIILFFVVWLFFLVLPWWLTVLALISLTIYFKYYIEVVFFGSLFDIIYFGGESSYYGFFISLVFLGIVSLLKPYFRN